jgi:hypothetical protein
MGTRGVGVKVAVDVGVGVGALVGDDSLIGVVVDVEVGVGAIGLLVGIGVDGSGVAVGGRKISVGVGEAMETRVGRLRDGRFKGRKKRAKAAIVSTAPLTPSMSHQETLLLPNS